MSLRTGLLALAFSAAALPALAHDPGAAPGAQGAAPAFRDIETQYIFGFTSGADIGAEGEKEVEVTTDANFRKRAGRFSTLSTKVELEYVPTQFLQLALGARGTVHAIRNVPGVADVNQTQFGGLSAEAKYLLVERSPNQPFALSLIVEPAWSRVGGEGGRERAFEIESKLAGDVMLIPNRLYAAVNLIWEPEAVKDRGARAYARESTLGLTGALTWRATPRLALGGELGYFRAYDSYLLSKYVGQALYLGPTLHAQVTKKTFVALSWGTQVAGSAPPESSTSTISPATAPGSGSASNSDPTSRRPSCAPFCFPSSSPPASRRRRPSPPNMR